MAASATPPDSCAMLPLPFDTRQAASHGWMLQILLGPFLGVYSSAVWSASLPATRAREPASSILVVAVLPWRGRCVWCRWSYKQCSVMPCPRSKVPLLVPACYRLSCVRGVVVPSAPPACPRACTPTLCPSRHPRCHHLLATCTCGPPLRPSTHSPLLLA
jgi:hypothetical protein